MSSKDLRTTFDEAASKYHLARPRYPEELFDVLVTEASLREGAQVLEIGAGTGLATLPMAARHFRISAVELGENLAGVLRANLSQYPEINVVQGAFEEINFGNDTFDLIYAATSFHWIKPEFKFTKTSRLLCPDGHLAIIGTSHVSDECGDLFLHASQRVYSKYYEGPALTELPLTSELLPFSFDPNYFKPKFFTAFPLVLEYTAVEYSNLLDTYSPTIALPHEARRGFLRDIEDLINREFRGSIVRKFAMTLSIATKISSS